MRGIGPLSEFELCRLASIHFLGDLSSSMYNDLRRYRNESSPYLPENCFTCLISSRLFSPQENDFSIPNEHPGHSWDYSEAYYFKAG